MLLTLISCSGKGAIGNEFPETDAVIGGVTTDAPAASEPVVTEPPITYPPLPELPEADVVTLVAVGDNLIHGYLITAGKTFGYDHFYDRIKDVISDADIAVINQESSFTYNSKIYSGYPYFATPTDVGIAAMNAGFDVFTFATNHVWDNGKQPVLDTIDFFKNYPEATMLGINETKDDYNTVKIIEKNGIKIAMFNYTYGFNSGKYPSQMVSWMCEKLANSNKERMKEQLIYAEENADITIVFPHWGTEYAYTPNSSQMSWAEFFTENGADIIIGHHPHAVQPTMEITADNGNKSICYFSLGNFISNQTYIKGNTGAMASLTIVKDENGTRVEEYETLATTVHATMVNGVRKYEAMMLSDLTDEMLKENFKLSHHTVNDFRELFDNALNSFPE